MKEVYQDLIDHLSGKDVTFSTWNLGKHARKYLTSKYNCKFNVSSSKYLDHYYSEILMSIFSESFDWATNEIGSWIVRNILKMKSVCFNPKNIDYDTMVNDFFTMKGEDISLLDIAHLYSVIDMAVLGMEVSMLDKASRTNAIF